MTEPRTQRRLAAILAADVVGYSRLMGQDEAGTLAALKARRTEVLAPTVAHHNGRVVKVMGDGVLVEFGGAVDAVQCAVEPGEEHCVVNIPSWDRLNIRSGPSAKTRIVSRKRYGSCGIAVVGTCRAQWCPVEDGHIKGWVNRRFLAMVSPSLYCTVSKGRREVVRLRAFPSPQSRVLIAIKRHTCGIAFLPYARGNWQKIRVDGWQGWISRGEVNGQ